MCWCRFRRQVPEGSGGFRAGVRSGGRFRKVPESSAVKWSRFRRQVPEGSGRFRKVLVYAGVGSRKVLEGSGRFWRVTVCAGGKFRKVPQSSAIEWRRFRRQVPDGSGRFWGVPVYAGVGSGGRFPKVLEGSGKFRRVPVCAGVGRRVSEGSRPESSVCVGVGSGGFGRSGEFRCGLLPCKLDRSSHVIALITGITINIVHMGKTIARKGAHVVKDGKRHKDVMLLLLGIPPKFIFFCTRTFQNLASARRNLQRQDLLHQNTSAPIPSAPEPSGTSPRPCTAYLTKALRRPCALRNLTSVSALEPSVPS